MTNLLLEWLIKTIVILLILVTAVAYVTLMERKVMAWIQLRVGPNRVGLGKFRLWGLMQPLADGLKMIFKEDFVPRPGELLALHCCSRSIINSSVNDLHCDSLR
jgi:NADH-quinone oxidoreductase subunit H